jgi:hypothetical protein
MDALPKVEAEVSTRVVSSQSARDLAAWSR